MPSTIMFCKIQSELLFLISVTKRKQTRNGNYCVHFLNYLQTLRPLYTGERYPVPTVQEAGWAPGPV